MRRKKKIPPVRILDLEYHQKRVEDLVYYIHRSDLTISEIARSVGFHFRWLQRVVLGLYKRPCDERISVIIAFLKDYERLQTYYLALGQNVLKNRKR